MRDADCVQLLRWALPRLGLRGAGFRRVRGQVCKRIGRRLRELGLEDAAAYRAHLEQHPEEWDSLDACCRVSISRFHRDRGVWDALAARVLPALAQLAARRGDAALRAWSAGCASGEEPWSLRLLWDLDLAGRHPGLGLEIVATDADPQLLARARRARYPTSSLRELPAAWRAQAFDPISAPRADAVLRAGLRHDVAFRRQDLRRRMPRGPFHLVLCRNLAFTYFGERLQGAVLGGLARRIVPGGALVLGLHESLPESAGFAAWPGVRAVWQRRARAGGAAGRRRSATRAPPGSSPNAVLRS